MFSNGIASQEMHLMLQLCSQHLGITFEHLRTWCESGWKCPKHTKNTAANVFSSRREATSKDGFKGIASELLCVFPLFKHFVEALVRPRCPDVMKDALESFSILCDIVATLQALKLDSAKITRQSCNTLKNMLATHLQVFQRAHGSDNVRPKHHLCQHLADQIFDCKFVIDCWPCERKHRSLKRLAGTIDNTKTFETSLLGRAIAEQLQCTPPFMFTRTLLGQEIEAPDLAESMGFATIKLANSMNFGCCLIAAGDVLIAHNTAMRVVACMRSETSFLVLVSSYAYVKRFGAGTLWKLQDVSASFALEANSFTMATYWTFQSDGILLTLHDDAL
jgi:hypothetical protein